MQFYHTYIVDVHYIAQVINVISVVVQENHLYPLLLPDNINCVLDCFH